MPSAASIALARQRRKTLALGFFPLDARLRGVLNAEDAHTPTNSRRSVTSSSRSPFMISTPLLASAAAR
jgi:hypothetical protein